MEEKNIEKIVIHYDNGEENTIHKGFMCGIKEDTESGEATLDFTMCHISGRDLEMIVMGCLQLGERLGMFDGRKEYDGVPALSRTDNETLICPECGTREAIDAALSVPEFSAGMTEQEKEEYKENVIRKIHENI